ncbi:MOP flippase family protein [Cytobacillus sp. FSL K6-0265]|uniref:MOP flippase family protein n=1 Tax=Cytobacillus sp. FSL K6-0265 TaxID=2921448 RepID=UPI0030FB8EC1
MTLRQKALSGAKWTTTSTGINMILQFIQLALIARILGPSALGLMGMVMIVIGFSQAFADMGISNAIIHRQSITKKQLSSLYWLNIFAGLVIFILLIIISPFVASFYQEPKIQELIYWAAAIFLITPFGQQFQILLQKELKFNYLAKIEVISTLVGTITTITFAYLGYGVITIVWGQLANATIKVVLLVAFVGRDWKPQIHFNKSDLEGFLSFGLYQMGERTLNYFNKNLDYIVIGKFLGPEALGYYTLAYNLIILPVSKINPIITRVAFPIFSKVQDQNSKLRKGYLQILNILSFVNFPIFIGLASTSLLFVPTIFGEEWSNSILLIQILAGVGLLRSTGNPAGSLLLSKGRADLGFKWNLLLMFTQVPGILLGLFYGGVVGVAIAYLFLEIIYCILNYRIIIRGLIGPCLVEYIGSMWSALWISIVMGVIVFTSSAFFQFESSMTNLIVQIIIGLLIYLILSLKFNKDITVELKRFVQNKFFRRDNAVER